LWIAVGGGVSSRVCALAGVAGRHRAGPVPIAEPQGPCELGVGVRGMARAGPCSVVVEILGSAGAYAGRGDRVHARQPMLAIGELEVSGRGVCEVDCEIGSDAVAGADRGLLQSNFGRDVVDGGRSPWEPRELADWFGLRARHK